MCQSVSACRPRAEYAHGAHGRDDDAIGERQPPQEMEENSVDMRTPYEGNPAVIRRHPGIPPNPPTWGPGSRGDL